MRYKIPQHLLDYFGSEAVKNSSVETLALCLGQLIEDEILVEELIFPSQTASSTEAIDNNGGNAILIVKAALSRACISQIRDQENLAKALTKSAIDLQLFIKSLANQVPKLISFAAATLNFCGRSQRLSNRPFQTSKTSKGY